MNALNTKSYSFLLSEMCSFEQSSSSSPSPSRIPLSKNMRVEVLYTIEPKEINSWVDEHILKEGNKSLAVGFDVEMRFSKTALIQ
jgi:hypothetical protein